MIATLCSLHQAQAIAQKEIEKVDSVLDRLEKRIMDEESQGLTFGERSLGDTEESNKNSKSVKIKGKKVSTEGTLPETRSLQEIGKEIDELEQQVDQLVADVQRTRQKALENSRVDNMILVDVVIKDKDSAAFRNLKIKVDGFEVYGVNADNGLWLPTAQVAVFNGPLQPGTHRLDIEARVNLKEKDGLPVNSDVTRYVAQSFDLKIPDGKFTKRFRITIVTDSNTKDVATIEESTLPNHIPVSFKSDSNQEKAGESAQ